MIIQSREAKFGETQMPPCAEIGINVVEEVRSATKVFELK
jgi:hypothetical protein